VVTPVTDRSDWDVKKCSSFEEMRTHRVRQWQKEPQLLCEEEVGYLVVGGYAVIYRSPSHIHHSAQIRDPLLD